MELCTNIFKNLDISYYIIIIGTYSKTAPLFFLYVLLLRLNTKKNVL